MFLKGRLFLLIIIVLSVFLVFWKIGSHDLSEWDEARNGVNAFEMYHNGDYVNLYYAQELDTWNAKPPLMIWLVVLCYRLIGYNELALRLPSAVCAILFFVVFYKLAVRLDSRLTAFVSCRILISCKAVIGFHVGINGDFDAMLMLLLTLSAYYFIRYIDEGDKKAIYLCAVFMALAFYTKGTAAFLFIPGYVLYAWLRGKSKYLFSNRNTWFAFAAFTCIIVTWAVLVWKYGKTSDHSFYGSKNALGTMLVHDTYRRLTSNSFEQLQQPAHADHLFFFSMLDVRLNVWNYLFYISILTGMIYLYKRRKELLPCIRETDNRLSLFSVCILSPMIVVMTIAVNKHDWYFAPFFGYIAYLTARGVCYIGKRWGPFYELFAGVFLFCAVRHFLFINAMPVVMNREQLWNKRVAGGHTGIILKDHPAQNVLLYLEWLDLPIHMPGDTIGISACRAQTIAGYTYYLQ